MATRARVSDRAWLDGQVAEYKAVRSHYELLAALLDRALRGAAKRLAPLATVQTRTKPISSFAEKALRKKGKHADPVRDFTDLCGARVVAGTRTDVDAVGKWVELNFVVDKANTVSAEQRMAQLRPGEFGYRSVHYIVSLTPDGDMGFDVDSEVRRLGRELGIEVTMRDLRSLKAEIQVRTTVEHAWADFGHDLSYKGAFDLPREFERQLAMISAQLEDVDQEFDRIEEGLQRYYGGYSYLSDDEKQEEIETLSMVLGYDPGNAELAARIGKLEMELSHWDQAIEVFESAFDGNDVASAYPPLLRDLGVALCKRHGKARTSSAASSAEFERGQGYLEFAGETHRDPDAIASLAGTWKGIDNDKALDLYLAAVELDPTNAYPLGNYLELLIEQKGDPSVVTLVRPMIREALKRRREQADVKMDMPWVFYDIGKFSLLLGAGSECVTAYAKAVQASTADWMVTTSLRSLNALSAVADSLPGYEWARWMLLLALAARFPDSDDLDASTGRRDIENLGIGGLREPVVIVAGGTDPNVEEKMHAYSAIMVEAFRGFDGTIIAGGTRQGISGLVGDLGAKYRAIDTIGYLPRLPLPADADLDEVPERYREIRHTNGEGFTPLEPLRNWIDLLGQRTEPSRVRLIGINGGELAGVEYRIALALGAQVGIIEGTGRAADELLDDEAWAQSPNLSRLSGDARALREFLAAR